jgi:hypothetical protein
MRGDREIVVVLAFKTVYTLEQKRRDNEKKIIALYVEMKDMMGVLLLYVQVFTHYTVLSYSFQPQRCDKMTRLVAPDGRSIEDRLKSIVERTADDIKKCSNVCDTYAKKKLLAKVFRGPAWDDKLLSWVTSSQSGGRNSSSSCPFTQVGVSIRPMPSSMSSRALEKFEYPRISSGYVLNRVTG